FFFVVAGPAGFSSSLFVGCVCCVCETALKAADIICKLWDRRYKKSPDLVVIEGAKAGGHLGFSLEEIESFNQDEYDMEIEKMIKRVG
ncbi:hypothetical protein CG709_17880, partial [Lachnotalea glycerini]